MSGHPFDKAAAKRKLKKRLGATIYSRGFSYYKKGAVGAIALSPRRAGTVYVEASVSGSDRYETGCSFDTETGNVRGFECDCPYDGGICKHAGALALALFDRYEDFLGSEDIPSDAPGRARAFSEWAKRYASVGEGRQKPRVPVSRDADLVPIPDGQEGVSISELRRSLESIGIDAGTIPGFVLETLGESVKPVAKAPKSRKRSGGGERETCEGFLKRYVLVLTSRYGLGLSLRERDDGPDRGAWPVSVDDILRDGESYLTSAQRGVLETVRMLRFSYYDMDMDADWSEVLALVRESGLDLYLDEVSPSRRLTFSEDGHRFRVKVSARPGNGYAPVVGVPRTDIVVDMADILSRENGLVMVGEDTFIAIVDRSVRIVPAPKSAVELMRRAIERVNEYRYESEYGRPGEDGLPGPYEVPLIDEELIGVNGLMTDLRSVFDADSDIPEPFVVKKFRKVGPAVSVKYDHAGRHLRVRAVVDYGFAAVDVSETVFRSTRGGKVRFQKRYESGRENYYVSVHGNAIDYAAISPRAEIEVFRRFSTDGKYGFGKRCGCIRKGERQIADYADTCWPEMKALGWPIISVGDEFDIVEERFRADVKVDFDSENDWFGFDVDCYCGENRITVDDLRNYVENGERFLTLPDGRSLGIENRKELERFVAMLRNFHQKEDQSFEGKLYHAPELEEIVAGSPHYTAKRSESFRNFMREAQRGKPVERVRIPAGIGDPLRTYQRAGIDWFHFLRKYRFGGILADDMGLGKTLQALSLVAMNPVAGRSSVVVCPKTLLFNWEDEVTKFFPDMKKLVISGSPDERRALLEGIGRYDLVIVSYPSVRKDSALYEGLKFNYCIIDEAQSIKNHRTQNARAVKGIHADYRLALTGTPLENSVSEIWSLFDFVMPGFLGTRRSFGERFERPIMKGGDRDALEALRKKTECFMLRRTKEKVLAELPSKVQQVSHCRLGDDQDILYQEILRNVKREVSEAVEKRGFAKSRIHVLAGLTKLRQVCNHPALLLKDDHGKYSSAKLDLFLELVDEIASSGRKVIVFSQFTRMLDILETELDGKKIRHLYLSGRTKNRKELVDTFNGDPDIPVFLISLKAGGTGLNLVSADSVIIFDPWWNPSVENQAIDRAHRIGQRKTVNVYRLIARGTIEEKIMRLQEKKQSLFDTVVGENEDIFRELTWSDVKELFETE